MRAQGAFNYLAQAGVRAHILACLLLLCVCRLCAGCSGQLRSCHQRWLRRERRAVCVCVRCLRFLACAVLYTATMARDGGSNDAKRKRAPQSVVARWASGGDSPCAAQTRPSPTKPERPPSSGHTDASAESWCAALHQGVACAQGQDVVVAHQPGGGDYLRINSLRRVERKCRLRWSGAVCFP